MALSKLISLLAKFFFSIIFSGFFVALGGAILFFGIRGLQTASVSNDWPQVKGEIVSSSVAIRFDNMGGKSFRAEVLYEFAVNGIPYNGNRVNFGSHSSSSHAREIVNRYPKGKMVNVYYNPDNPEESVLEPGMKFNTWFAPVFGLIFFSAGCVMAYFLPKSMGRTPEPAAGFSDN